MKLRSFAGILGILSLATSLFLGVNAPPTWAGPLRITMNDGTSVEVPYYWEEDGEFKFEFPGGVAGLPKDQVKSVQEVIASKEFDPESIVNKPESTSPILDQKQMLQDLVVTKAPLKASTQKLSNEDGIRMMKDWNAGGKQAAKGKEKAYGPTFNVEGDYSEFVRAEGKDVMVLMRSVLSSRKDLKNENFALTLYDGEGKVLEQKPCELHPLDADRKTLKKIGIKGHLYIITATVRPDQKIRRYEITAMQR